MPPLDLGGDGGGDGGLHLLGGGGGGIGAARLAVEPAGLGQPANEPEDGDDDEDRDRRLASGRAARSGEWGVDMGGHGQKPDTVTPLNCTDAPLVPR